MPNFDNITHNSSKHKGTVICHAFDDVNPKKDTNSRGPKKTPDYDNVFKTLKMKYKELFIPVINNILEENIQ